MPRRTISLLPRHTGVRAPRPDGARCYLGVAVLVLLAAVLTACTGSSQPASVDWRNVEMDLPAGWYLFEDEADRLSISNQDIGIGDVAGEPNDWPEGDVVAMFFTYEPTTGPGDWRELLDQLDAEIEADNQLRLQGEVPATQLIYRYETEGVLTREMVVVIPSRAIVLLAQPVPPPGSADQTEVFLAHLDDFMGVLESAVFGAPVLD